MFKQVNLIIYKKTNNENNKALAFNYDILQNNFYTYHSGGFLAIFPYID